MKCHFHVTYFIYLFIFCLFLMYFIVFSSLILTSLETFKFEWQQKQFSQWMTSSNAYKINFALNKVLKILNYLATRNSYKLHNTYNN